MATVVHETALKQLSLLNKGKVRDIYAVDDQHLLMVTTDRLSAFDVVLPTAIPEKGRLLTEVAHFWFDRLQSVIPNHLSDKTLKDLPLSDQEVAQLKGRSMIVKKLRPLPVEAIVRGYLIGSGWKDYQETGSVCGIPLEAGLKMAEKLPNILFTPSTKANKGDHDINIDFAQMQQQIGKALAEEVRTVSLTLYQQAAAYALSKGIIIADTKFEFGLDDNNQLFLIDEILTPDSSRFWPENQYQVGISPPSYDKQFVRDYLETLNWNKTSPGPQLPKSIVDKTTRKYQEVRDKLLD